MDIISAIASFNALIIAFAIYSRKNKTISDKILIVWIVNFAFHFAIPFLIEHDVLFHKSYWGLLMGVFVIAHAPLIFVYTNSLTNPQFKANFKNLYHFGFILIYVVSMIPYLLLSNEERISIVTDKQDLSIHMILPMIIMFLCKIYFLSRTIIILIKHHYSIKQEFSYDEKVNLTWLKRIAYGFVLLFILTFVEFWLVSVHIISIYWMDYSMIIANMILFFYIAYSGYRQKSIYTSKPTSEIVYATAKKQAFAYEEDEYDPVIKELCKKMIDERLYIQPELNLGDLANIIGVHAHQLSKLINEQLGKNFFEFVNEYRIEEFKKLVANPKNKHFSILGLALDSGFNSKASFNRIFKNNTGFTPSEFRNSYKF